MRIIRFLIFTFLVLSISSAWADIAPWPGGNRNNIYRQHEEERLRAALVTQAREKISLANADVKVQIVRMKPQNGASGKEPEIIANVRGEFDLLCSAQAGVDEGLRVIFPVFYEQEGQGRILKFTAGIDGKSVANVSPQSIPMTINTEDKPSQVLSASGFTWTLPGFSPAQKRHIVVEYSYVLPWSEGKAHFTYILTSGALWEGPISREVVTASAGPGLLMNAITPVGIKAEQGGDDSLTWTIANAKPAEDIRLSVSSHPGPKAGPNGSSFLIKTVDGYADFSTVKLAVSLGAIHALVDAACVAILYAEVALDRLPHETLFALVLLYNSLAFGLQWFFGFLADLKRSYRFAAAIGTIIAAVPWPHRCIHGPVRSWPESETPFSMSGPERKC